MAHARGGDSLGAGKAGLAAGWGRSAAELAVRAQRRRLPSGRGPSGHRNERAVLERWRARGTCSRYGGGVQVFFRGCRRACSVSNVVALHRLAVSSGATG